jgi:hypothetical protein
MMQVELKKSAVVFDRASHTYMKDGQELHGVTPIVHWLFPETYAGIPQFVMDAAADYGHMIHSACQMSDVVGITEHESVIAYQELKKAFGLTTIANEFLVSDEVAVASSIDVVCEEQGVEGDALIDIKTTSKVHTNHLAVQLSIYAWLYEWQTGRKVGNLYCCWLPKKRYGEPAMLPVMRIPADVCQFIVKQYFGGVTNEACREKLDALGVHGDSALEKVTQEIPAEYSDVVEQVISIETELKSLKDREKTLKDGLLALMRENGVKKWEGDGLTLTYVAETTRKAVDSTKLKKDYPEVYEACMKESKVSDSIKISIN